MGKFNKIYILAIVILFLTTPLVFAKTGTIENTSEGLVFRESASKEGAPISTLANGTTVEIIAEEGDWYKVKYNEAEGYLFKEFVKVNEEQPAEIILGQEKTVLPVDQITTNPTEEVEQKQEITTLQNKVLAKDAKVYIMPAISSSIIANFASGTNVIVESEAGNWSYVTAGNIKGWIRNYNFSTSTTTITNPPAVEPEAQEPEQEQEQTTQQETKIEEEQTTKPEEKAPEFSYGYVNEESINVRKEPSTESEIITTLTLNTGVYIDAEVNDWYKVHYEDYNGYIAKFLISIAPTASSRSLLEERTDSANQNDSAPVTETALTEGERIVNFAKEYLGYDYVYGGTTPSGFDCSGFTYYVLNSCGHTLSRSCEVQAESGEPVSRGDLIPGDLIFYDNTSDGSIGHVGIYIGNGDFIHAANPTRGVVIDTIESGYYDEYYYSARRIVD